MAGKSKFSFKRLLSAVLALCMIIGAMPSIALFDAKAADPVDLYYDFIKGNIGTGMGTAHVKTINDYKFTTAGDAAELNPTIASEPWYVKTISAGCDGGGGYFAYIGAGKGPYLYGNDYKAGANTYYAEIAVKVTADGKYIPQVNLCGATEWSYETVFTATLSDSNGDKVAERVIMFPTYDVPNHYLSLTNTPVEMKKDEEYILKLTTMAPGNGTFVVNGLKLADAATAIGTEMVIGDNDGIYTVKVGESVEVPLSVTMSDGSTADLSKATFEYSTADIATAEIANGKLKITAGEAAGKTTLTVRHGAAMARTNINVVEEYAAAGDLVYDFVKPIGHNDKKMYNQAYVEHITFGNTTAGGYGEILGPSRPSAPWAFYKSSVTGGNSYVKYNNNNVDYGIAMYQRGDYTYFKVKVTHDGMYTPSVTLNGTSTQIGISLMPINGDTVDVNNPLFNKGGIGAGGSTPKTFQLADGPVAIKAGTYVVNFNLGKSSSDFAYLNKLTLKYEGEISANLFVSAQETAKVEIGKTVDVPLTLTMGDGSAIDYSKVEVATEFSTANIATATPVVDDTSAKVTFEGDAIGETEATITVTYSAGATPVIRTTKVKLTVDPLATDIITASIDAGVVTMNAESSVTVPVKVVDAAGDPADVSTLSVTVTGTDGVATAEVDKTNGLAIKFTGVAEGTATAAIAVTNGKSTSNITLTVKVNAKDYVEVRDYFYNFKKGYTGDTSLQSVQKVTYAMTEAGSDSEVNKNIVSDPWAYYNDDSAAQNDGNNYFKYNGNAYGPCKSRKNFGALKIKVPATGTYVPFALMYRGTNVFTTVKLSKVGENGKIGDAIATSEFAAGAITETKDYQIGTEPVYLEAGEYVVSVHNSVTNGLSIIDGFRLVNDATLLRAAASPDKVEVVKGTTADVKITVKDNKGNVVPASSLTTTVSGINESLATAVVGADGDDVKLTFTGVALGNTEAKVSFATADGKKGDIKIAVETLANFGLDITLDIPDKLAVGSANDYTVVAKRAAIGSSESADAAVTVTATSSNTNILKATVTAGADNKNNKIKLEGLIAGAANVKVVITCEDVTKTFNFPILVTDTTKNTTKNYKYFYHKNLPYGGNGFDITTVTSFLDTLPGTALRAGDTDNWRFAGISDGAKFYRKYDTYGGALEMGQGIWTSMEVRLPRSGIYEIVGEATEYIMAGIYRIYIAPKGAENPMDPKYSVGSHDCYYGESKDYTVPQVKATLRTIELEAGDYIVTWECAGKNGNSDIASPRLYPDGIYFNAKEALPTITVTPVTNSTTLPKYTKALVKLEGSVSDGSADDLYGAQFNVTATNADIVDAKPVFNKNGVFLEITGKNIGSTKLTIDVTFNGTKRATFTQDVTVTEESILDSIKLGLKANTIANVIYLHPTNSDKDVDDVKVTLIDTLGREISAESVALQDFTVTYASSDTSVAEVDENGHIKAYKVGTTDITVTVKLSGVERTDTFTLSVTAGGKQRSSYRTKERVAAMRENARLYDWATSTMLSYTNQAEKFIGEEEKLWNMITSQELPRSYYVGYRGDPKQGYCRYCGANIADIHGSALTCWRADPWNDPWKIQCPECRKKFPTNDFEKFYALGLGEDGLWHYDLAKQENQKLVDAGQPGYLVNELLPEKGEGWGVDDGYGYVDKTESFTDMQGNTMNSVHTYISYYNHEKLWHASFIYNTVDVLMNSYMYTGDLKYGRVGAVMIDRIADLYRDFDTAPYRHQFTDGGHYPPKGKTSDYIWENQNAKLWVEAYDVFWDVYEDEKVISFLSDKASQYGIANSKANATMIRNNIEDNILRHIFEEMKIGDIWGNFGMPHSTLALTAVVLDTMPETKEMLDWVYQDGEAYMLNGALQYNHITGGNLLRQLINAVDANGVSDEIAPNYSALWLNGVANIARCTAGYDKYPEGDLYNNPRFVKMFTWQVDTFLRRKKMPAIGDSGATAMDNNYHLSTFHLVPAYTQTKDPRLAQILYQQNGNKVEGLHYEATIRNPNSIQDDIMKVIREQGVYDYDKSLQLTDFGYAVLKSGSLYGSGDNQRDTQRAFWMFYGRGSGHGHRDALNLGIEAHGFDMAPDLGYPDGTTGPRYAGWGQTTVVHNTVVVNDKRQAGARTTGIPYHFDDAGRVKVMDADAKHQYSLDTYRRIVVAVDIDDEDTYAVDFFHVKGGNEHLYSFHSHSNEITTTGLNLVEQVGGSYAGPDVPYDTNVSDQNGYGFLKDVKRAANVTGGNFSVDFKIKDFRDYYETDPDAHLKMTMVNGFDLSEVATANGRPPVRDGNPSELTWVLARRSGQNMNTLFTTVFEPYVNDSKISSIEAVEVKRADGAALAADEDVKAVKVTLKDGRTDYVVFNRKNSVEYRVADLFNIQGIVGVYSVKDGKNIYSYVNDGGKIGDLTGTGNLTGKVVDFTKGIEFKNTLTISIDQAVNVDDLIGRYVYVTKTGTGNATYEILGATKQGNNYVLDIGDITLVDKLDEDGDYVYAVEVGKDIRIPMSLVKDSGPVIEPIPDQQTEAGAEFKYTVRATSPNGEPIKYSIVSGPSGVTIDETTGVLTWVAQGSHRGTHAIVVGASNGTFDSSVTFNILVHNASSPSTGGGGGGENSKLTVKFETNGGSKVANKQVAKGEKLEKPADPTKDGYTFDGWYLDAELTNKYDFDAAVTAALTLYAKWVEGEADEDGKRFIDLGNHKWAEDAIYRLVDAGVVNGTSENTYSPGVNITRADFTTLIVRAFKFEAEVATFADVDASKYYATPIGIAKTLGVVNGVNATDFAPTAQITRQDMMVIIYRALKVAGVEITKTENPTFSDADAVSAYAKEAVEALTGAGLIAGSNGKINPKANTTRAEVAVVLDRILNK